MNRTLPYSMAVEQETTFQGWMNDVIVRSGRSLEAFVAVRVQENQKQENNHIPAIFF